MDDVALILYEADQIARERYGDEIQTGDIDRAKGALQGRSKGNYWFLAAGAILAGAGFQGGIDALLSAKGTGFIIVYSVAFILGLIFIYMATPRK
jgi:hypothetical protein